MSYRNSESRVAGIKRRNQLHARKSWRRNIVHKRKLREKRRHKEKQSQEAKQHSDAYLRADNAHSVTAPEICSMLNNTEEFCQFIGNLHYFYINNLPVFVNMKKVVEIDDDAILVLLSIMIEFKQKYIKYNGNYPVNKTAKSKFENSKFFHYLNSKHIVDEHYLLNSADNQIVTHANKDVNSDLATEVLDDATKFLWGTPRYSKGAYRTIIELMQNTNNHASLTNTGERHWWLSISKDSVTNSVSFAFIDYGIGIFQSLKHKKSTHWLKKQYEMLISEFHNNCDILRRMLSGEMTNTSTGEIYRGKGIPGIKEVLDRKGISSLHIITNDVYSDVGNDIYKKLQNKINGTFVYWELNKENIYHDK
ncbi:MAG: hypothetical protein M0Q99_07190 [Candidatus Cloacimonetes bacterium]|nr:hypothetical protein [Candidatus Cloacimonadota bacterium]